MVRFWALGWSGGLPAGRHGWGKGLSGMAGWHVVVARLLRTVTGPFLLCFLARIVNGYEGVVDGTRFELKCVGLSES